MLYNLINKGVIEMSARTADDGAKLQYVINISSKLFATTPSLGIPEKVIALMGLMLGLTLKPVMLSEAKHLGGRPKGAKSNISVDAWMTISAPKPTCYVHAALDYIYLQEHCHIYRNVIHAVFTFIILCVNNVSVHYAVREFCAKFIQRFVRLISR